MKTKLLIFLFLLTSGFLFSQISAGQVDDFEDGTIQGWTVGGGSSTTNITTGGPDGVDDNFLQYATTGAPGGPGSKMIIFNRTGWTGNFTTEGIVEIQFDVKVEGTNDLELRFSVSDETGQGTPSGTRISSTNSVIVTAGSGWNSVSIPISVSDFTVFEGSATVADVLASVAEARILHAPTPNWFGTAIGGTLQLDNITASTTLSRQDISVIDDFSIYPNPSRSNLNINLKDLGNNTKIEVYNILGKKILGKELNALKTSINVSQWNSGVYLVRLINNDGTVTKRFVKQ